MPRNKYKFLFLVTLLGVFLLSCVHLFLHDFGFETLSENYRYYKLFVSKHYYISIFIFSFVYILTIGVAIPGATLLTLLAGFLFGLIPGVMVVVFSATVGACLLYLLVKTTVGGFLRRLVETRLSKAKKIMLNNEFSYILFLRLLPIFPFWAVNILASIMEVRMLNFALATFIGIIPATSLYVYLGQGLSDILQTKKPLIFSQLISFKFFLPLSILALLALAPVLYKNIMKK